MVSHPLFLVTWTNNTRTQAIFAQSCSCVQICNMMTSEAARMAQQLCLNKATYHEERESECCRTFWVIYILEKLQSFVCGRTSVRPYPLKHETSAHNQGPARPRRRYSDSGRSRSSHCRVRLVLHDDTFRSIAHQGIRRAFLHQRDSEFDKHVSCGDLYGQ